MLPAYVFLSEASVYLENRCALFTASKLCYEISHVYQPRLYLSTTMHIVHIHSVQG